MFYPTTKGPTMMRYRLAAIVGVLAATALIFVGSAKAEPFTPEDQAIFAAAVDYWALPVPCGPVELEVVPAGSLGIYGGWTEGCRIQIVDSITRRCDLKDAIYHETGHLLGLEHSLDPTSLMYPEDQHVFCRIEERAARHARWHRVHLKAPAAR